MSQEMGAAFALLRDGPDLWCAILTEAGDKILSAGWDLKALVVQRVDLLDQGDVGRPFLKPRRP